MQRLPIFFKQREDQFYPGWAFNLPAIITRLPYTLVEVLIWTALTYYIVGLAPDAGRCVRTRDSVSDRVWKAVLLHVW